tara:strand:- start:562 stop:1350 length:789 start_codon:yes stop_codon:yes gene_type:complete
MKNDKNDKNDKNNKNDKNDKNDKISTKHNSTCITDCYAKNTNLILPFDFKNISSKNNFCVTKPYNIINNETGEIIEKKIDQCSPVTNNTNKLYYSENLQKIYFNETIILQDIYAINKFQHFLSWYEDNETENYYTKLRVLNCVWLSKIIEKDLLNEYFIDIHINLFKVKYLFKLSEFIQDKIKIVDNNIKISKTGSTPNEKDLNNYIITKFLTPNTFSKFLFKYNETNNEINNETIYENKTPIFLIFNKFIKYIVDKVNKTI